MISEENIFKDTVFRKNYSNDPFREENFLFEHKDLENEKAEIVAKAPLKAPETKTSVAKAVVIPAKSEQIFRLNLGESMAKLSPKESVQEKAAVPAKKEPAEEKRTFKGILKDASRQIIASAAILVLGFIILNFSAIYQITKYKINELTGNTTKSPLYELVEDPVKKTPSETVTTEVQKIPETTKRQLPALALEVAPIDNRLIIPRIDQNIPIVRVSSENLLKRDWNALEKDMQNALKDGVVHYPGTSLPGQSGNTVITGHSSYFPWDPGNFKDVFALLHKVVIGDDLVIYYDQEKYQYKVESIDIVLPDELDVLKQTPGDKLTLITCTPVGTNLKRLVVTAVPVEKETELQRN